MSSKINAIYAALDNGNPKSALRLCQAFLQKSSSNIVKGLMALSLSRLDQSDAAISICADMIKTCPSLDQHTIETITYVLRREREFSLLADLLTNFVDNSKSPSIDTLVDCFVANLQANKISPLPQLAMRLFKLSNDPRYLAWYAFSLVEGIPYPPHSDDADKRILNMALLTLDKVLVSAKTPDENGVNRWTTSGRMNLYIQLYKIQILKNLGEFNKAIEEVKKINSTLISSQDKNDLIEDLKKFSSNNYDANHFGDTILKKFHSKTNPSLLDQIYISIGNDAIATSAISESTSEFTNPVSNYMIQTIDRSDCLVLCSQFLPLITRNMVSSVVAKISPLLTTRTPKSPKSLINVHKLLYGLGEPLPSPESLISLAKPLIESENCLDECSPGKQILLLAVFAYMEKNQVAAALSLLSYGSNKFGHCSHFRLIECLIYGRVLKWSKKSLEKFHALGIKNAQWRSLFWLIEPIVAQQYIGVDERAEISGCIINFFDRHKFELKQNYKLILEECMFWKFGDYSDNCVGNKCSPSLIWTETEKYWSELMEDFEVTQEIECGKKISTQMGNLEYDYSPLLFASILAPNDDMTTTTKTFWKNYVQREMNKPRCCGFKWYCSETESKNSREKRFEKFSKNRFPGKLLIPSPHESTAYMQMRHDLMALLISILRGENGAQETVVEISNEFKPFNQQLYDFMKIIASSSRIDQNAIDPIIQLLNSVHVSTKNSTTCEIPIEIGLCLNGWIQAIVTLIEFTAARFSKKSEERKLLKMEMRRINESIVAIMKGLDEYKNRDSILLIDCSELAEKDFSKKFTQDFVAEINMIKAGFQSVSDRINLGKV